MVERRKTKGWEVGVVTYLGMIQRMKRSPKGLCPMWLKPE